ncbi:MAG: hypothetical protein WCR55_01535 [Lentisphaerota bacterium]
MRKQKAIVYFAKVKENELWDISRFISNKMKDNPNFPNPPISIAKLDVLIEEYHESLMKCDDGTKLDTAIKNNKRTILLNNLSILGNYVNTIANNDLVKLDSSGFPISKTPSRVGILDAPKYIHINYGNNPGEIFFEIEVAEKASGYIILFSTCPAPENDKDWHSYLSSRTKGMISGLESEKKYIFKAAATSREANKIGRYNFTDPVTKFVP